VARRIAPDQLQGSEARTARKAEPRKLRGDVRALATLKPAGGSLVLTVPVAIRKALHYAAGTELSVTVEGSKMVVEAVDTSLEKRVRRPRYTLEQLLAGSDPDAPLSEHERQWHDASPVGRESW